MFDLIVIGGGPVGLYLAKEFQEKGSSVLILDASFPPPQKNKLCSGLVSKHLFEFVPKDNFFIEKKFSCARCWIEENPFDFKGEVWLIDRAKFDQYLFEKAEKAGIEIKTGKKVVKVEEKKDLVKVVLENGKEFQGKVLAGCDGAVSITAREIGLPLQKNLLLGVIAYSKIENCKRETEAENFPNLFFSKKFPGFFIWRIPRKEVVEWGIALKPKQKPKQKLENFLKEKNIKYKNLRAALIPFYPLKRTVSSRVFLCGDAAGQIKPATGGGIVYGLIAARIASRVINPSNPKMDVYEKKWRQALMKEISFGNFLRGCYYLPNFLKRTGIAFLQKRQKLDQDKPSSILG